MLERPLTLAALALLSIAAVQAASTITVDQQGLVFSQRTASVQRGDRIVFVNGDDVIHNIHLFADNDEDERDLGLQKPGVRLNYQFDKAGRFTVRCNIHPSMKMVVMVR